eukprot:TRINITY_DN126585_c0_g1_i1.p1 TRINITY_DN126585_c0_g1~~TRINITY_DN126585_c0_g1_i1.p1  ORF type:complete len:169 (-),score=21.25 TRINITY_DN126585_c0_g1_i1:170-616(-)
MSLERLCIISTLAALPLLAVAGSVSAKNNALVADAIAKEGEGYAAAYEHSLVRRERSAMRREDCPNMDAGMAVAAAEDGCTCGTGTKCETNQYCLRETTATGFCLNDCSFSGASSTTINYNGATKCKCGTAVCDSGTHLACSSNTCTS